MDFKVVPKPAFKIIGLQLSQISNNKEIPKLWGNLSTRFEELNPLSKKPIMAYGVCSNFDMATNIFDYTAALEVENSDIIPDQMVMMEIPEQEYAVFESTLPTIMETINNIYKEWLPNSDYNRASGPEFEEYDSNFDPNIPESKLLLYIPIEKK